MHWKGASPPPPLQGAQPMPSHCLPDAKCLPEPQTQGSGGLEPRAATQAHRGQQPAGAGAFCRAHWSGPMGPGGGVKHGKSTKRSPSTVAELTLMRSLLPMGPLGSKIVRMGSGIDLLRADSRGRDALERKGPQRRPQKRLGRRLEEIAKAVGGGYCRL